jgi:hypothetical protein
MKSNNIERGAASLLIELNNGCITVYHGTDKNVLKGPIEVTEGTWKELFNTIQDVIFDNSTKYKSELTK